MKSNTELPSENTPTSIGLNSCDSLLHWTSISAILGLIAYFIYGITYFPETIPVHFDATGHADRMGGKSTLWLLLAIPSVLWFVLNYVQRNPERLNYAVTIHEKNRQRQYRLAHRLLASYKLFIPCLSLVILWNVHGTTMNIPHLSEGWFALLMLTMVILPLPIYLLLSFREPKN
ncbi:MAG: DUF1648 domain-containing protein [Flavobacteriales bacterium]